MQEGITDADLLHLSCQLLDSFFSAVHGHQAQPDLLGKKKVHEALDVY